MMQVVRQHNMALSLMFPGVLFVGLLTAIAAQTGMLTIPVAIDASLVPQTVTISPRPYSYRDSGDFLAGTAAIDGPRIQVDAPAALESMKFQVSAADYRRCVADGDCHRAEPRRPGTRDVPATGVSFNDATDYATWLSTKTGETWRLPTVSEWAFAAGSKAGDPALSVETDPANPADRWLAFYEKEAALGVNSIATPGPLGHFGVNEFGVADMSASVWEWTATCASRTALGQGGEVVSRLESCGVRYLEGRHRTPMTGFVRDAQSGGCSIGAPPDNLGFRLVRDRGPLAAALKSPLGRAI
jgi:formylglycine-generating enzyme required for sulfatase activity